MKIAIAGYGVEGKTNYEYWSKDPANEVTIVDGSETPTFPVPEGVPSLLGPNVFSQLDGFDLVIRTAGLSPYSIKTDGRVWSATNEFFSKCPAPIIGVTGSKGKGTTASLIAGILRAAGKKVWLVGNIGQAALDVLDQVTAHDIVVYELSSFQLWDIQYSPHTAVVLFIEREHLDVHPSMEDYVAAKARIVHAQTEDDVVIFMGDNPYTQQVAASSRAVKIGFPAKETAHVKDGYFYNGEQKLCSVESLVLKGEHNLLNAIAAINAVWEYTQDTTAITQGLTGFKGLPHRLSVVDTVKGVTYVDDSIATTPSSAIAALRSFQGPKVLIAGGSKKGSDFTEFAQELPSHDVTVLLLGDEAQTIAASCDAVGFTQYERIENPTMTNVVRRAAVLAQPGSIVLLSPAAASFGLFKNYVDRGEQFIAAVQQLSNEAS